MQPSPMGFFQNETIKKKYMFIKISKAHYKAIMDALRICSYSKEMTYTERLPYLNAYLDLEYKRKREERKERKEKKT